MIDVIPVLTACQVSAEASSSARPQLTAEAEPLDGAAAPDGWEEAALCL